MKLRINDRLAAITVLCVFSVSDYANLLTAVTAVEVMRERSADGVTIDEVLTRGGAPRGSVYYHFPNGRNQILTEALRYSGEEITATIDDAAERGALALVRHSGLATK
jgi:AcrR family transcriptional regulator